MNVSSGWLLLPLLAVVVCAWLSGVLRQRLLRAAIVDHANQRSLHVGAVPRGGGVAIAITVLACQAALIAAHLLPLREGLAWWSAGAACALLGWCDDLKPRSARLRLVAQCVICGAFLLSLEPSPATLTAMPVQGLLLVFALVAMVGFINAFNFMDGADAFAPAQMIIVGVVGAAGLLLTAASGTALMALVIAGAALGFVRWNWHPARLFMGDSGSYFLGFQCAALAVVGSNHGVSAALWAIVLMPFLVDPTLTLVARACAGVRWWQPHREHAYQRLVLNGWSPVHLVAALAALHGLVSAPSIAWVLSNANHGVAATAAALVANVAVWFTIRRRCPIEVNSRPP